MGIQSQPGCGVRALGTTRLTLLALALGPATATQAAVLTFDYTTEFTGGAVPAGAAPWLTATFTDGPPGIVTLSLNQAGLTGSEFTTEWFFNLDPALDPSQLQFTPQAGVGTFNLPTPSTGVNNQSSAGSYGFDLRFAFSTGNSGSGRFSAGETHNVQITSLQGALSATDFDFTASAPGNNPPLPVATHVQGLANGESSWTTVPEPSSLLSTSLGAACLAMWRRRRHRQEN